VRHLFLRIIGKYVPKARPRFGRGSTYMATDYDNSKHAVTLQIIGAMRKASMKPWPSHTPIGVEVTVVVKRPGRRPRYVPVDAWEDGGRIYGPGTKGDVDNLGGTFMDAANPSVKRRFAGLWKDDSHVVWLFVRKVYGRPGERPVVEVDVRELGWVVLTEQVGGRDP